MRPTHGELIPLNPQQTQAYPSLVTSMEGLGDLQNGIDSPAATAFKQKVTAFNPQQMHAFIDDLAAASGYAHGTHVAGIAARGNPAIRLAYARLTYDLADPHTPPTEELASRYLDFYASTVAWFRANHIRVVNMSWWNRPSNYEKDLADNGLGKDAADRKQLARHFFNIERDAMLAALQSAPDILFVTIAGNNDADNAFEECIPSSFKLPNLLVTGAVDQAGDETGFTSYGDNVFIDADGRSVESVVPGGAHVRMTGTSMAAPGVTNLAAKLLAINPALTPPQLITLIRNGADTTPDGRRHLLNPKRSVELLEAEAQAN